MQMTRVDYTRHLALVVTTREAAAETVIADARYVLDGSDAAGEFAIVVADRWHGKGIGQRVMQALLAAAAGQGVQGLWGDVHESSKPMLALMKRSGFRSAAGMAGEGFLRVERSTLSALDTAAPPRHTRPAARLARLWARLRPAGAPTGAGLRQGGEG
jgi:acetyltransferase